MTALTSTPDRARECFEAGVRAYPELKWTFEEFRQAWQAAPLANPERETNEDDFIRLACLSGCHRAVEVFDRHYLEPLRPVLLRICSSPESADDAMQKFREKLLLPPSPRLASYTNTGSFRAWLKVVASRTALDMARSKGIQARREEELHERLEHLAAGPEARFAREELRSILRISISDAIKRLPVHERQALRLHLVSGWNITQIGRAFSIHRATAARRLVSAKEHLGELLREELKQRRGSANANVDELLQELPSRLDLSLSQMFSTTGVFQATG